MVEFAEDKVENNVVIGTALTLVDIPDRFTLLLQVNKALILTNNNTPYGVVIR